MADGVEAAPPVRRDGTWDRVHSPLLAEADAAGEIDWGVGGLHDQPGASARHEPAPSRPLTQGEYRITRIAAGRAG